MESSSTTASEIVTFAGELEDEASRFYKTLATRFTRNRETFQAFAKESEKNKLQLIRTYRETISDALEACFSFKGLNLGDYVVKTRSTEGLEPSAVIRTAVELEENASRFYSDAARLSSSLLATIPGMLRRLANRRNNRKLTLKSIL